MANMAFIHRSSKHWTFPLILSIGVMSVCVECIIVTTPAEHRAFGDAVEILECTYTEPTSYPDARFIQWSKKGEGNDTFETVLSKRRDNPVNVIPGFGRFNLTGTDASMIINDVQKSDHGTYKCFLDFYLASEFNSSETLFYVLDKVTNVFLGNLNNGDTMTGQVDKEYNFPCSVYMASPVITIEWRIDNATVDEETSSNDTNIDGTVNASSTMKFVPTSNYYGKGVKIDCVVKQSDGNAKAEYSTSITLIIDDAKCCPWWYILAIVITIVLLLLLSCLLYFCRDKLRKCCKGNENGE